MANSPMNLPEKFKKMAILSGYFTEASKMPAKDWKSLLL
jgi:hypothetical protein